MITWSQQHKLITDIFFSFQNGKITHLKLQANLEKDKMFLRPSKYEALTLGNFKILLLDTIYKNNFTSKIDFMKKLNSLDKTGIKKTGQLRTDLLSFNYIIEKDKRVLETLNITPYNAYKQKLIHPFTLGKYYRDNSTDINGRIMKKDIDNAKVLISFFNV